MSRVRKSAGIPNITGSVGLLFDGAYGAFTKKWNDGWGGCNEAYAKYIVDFEASRSSSIYGKSSTVTPLSLSSIFVIKY